MSIRNKIFTNTLFVIFIMGSTQSAQAAYLRCYKGTLENPQITPLESPLPLIENASCINKDLDTVFFAFGFTRSPTTKDSITILTAYLSKGNVNVILLDWAEEAKIGILGTVIGYIRAVINTGVVGKKYATALLTLAGAGLNLRKVHLIGHSLGAQLSGVAGNTARTKGVDIGRITGLDPAKPLYEGFLSIHEGLNVDSAIFVDIVHTDPGQYGIEKSTGTADFYPNYNDDNDVQPGCPVGIYVLLSDESLCSHDRAWAYFAESVLNKDAFPAAGELDYDAWINNNGTTKTVAYMGEYVSPIITGLDPAKPLYEGFLAIHEGLNVDSAIFVDIVHTDPGQYGIEKSTGTADFYPNYNDDNDVQPGCPVGIYVLLSDESVCSHDRAWAYFAESVLNKDAFPAAGELDYDAWINNNGTIKTVAYMGEYVSPMAKGNFYLVTNDQSPFGKGKAGTIPNE